uniref:RNase H domain-containing protein n=1 Tax=Steinernema glaseri TaxID=37863 RepID=A0A1I7ZHH5_9BILA
MDSSALERLQLLGDAAWLPANKGARQSPELLLKFCPSPHKQRPNELCIDENPGGENQNKGTIPSMKRGTQQLYC